MFTSTTDSTDLRVPALYLRQWRGLVLPTALLVRIKRGKLFSTFIEFANVFLND